MLPHVVCTTIKWNKEGQILSSRDHSVWRWGIWRIAKLENGSRVDQLIEAKRWKTYLWRRLVEARWDDEWWQRCEGLDSPPRREERVSHQWDAAYCHRCHQLTIDSLQSCPLELLSVEKVQCHLKSPRHCLKVKQSSPSLLLISSLRVLSVFVHRNNVQWNKKQWRNTHMENSKHSSLGLYSSPEAVGER